MSSKINTSSLMDGRIIIAIVIILSLIYILLGGFFFPQVNTTYKDSPGGGLSTVQFDFEKVSPGRDSKDNIRLYLCTQHKYYRIISREITPNPRLLVDRTYPVTQECGYKYPVINMNVGDVEEISIGVADTENITDVYIYRITRMQDGGITGETVGMHHTEISTPLPTPTFEP